MAEVLYIDNIRDVQQIESIERRLTKMNIDYDFITGSDYEVEKAFQKYDLRILKVLIENVYPQLEIYDILSENPDLKHFKISKAPRLQKLDDADLHWQPQFYINKERMFVFGYDSLRLFPTIKKALKQ